MFFALTEHLKNLVRSILAMQYIDLTRALISSSSERTLLIVTPRYLILFTNSTYKLHYGRSTVDQLQNRMQAQDICMFAILITA